MDASENHHYFVCTFKGKTMRKVASSSHRQNISWKIFSTVDSSVHLNKPLNGRLEREKWNSKPPFIVTGQ